MKSFVVTLNDGRRINLSRRTPEVHAASVPSVRGLGQKRPATPARSHPKRLGSHAWLSGPTKELWTEVHAPAAFRDLLSEERLNREVLRAVKSWDPFVFKRGKPADAADVRSDLRPDERLILLCGPPGTGKTTLAQVALRQAGYNVVEVNASDDRTASVLKDRLTGAMTCNAIAGPNRNKPTAVILDEIDGADGKGAVDVLIQMAKAPLRRAKESAEGKTATRAPRKKPSEKRAVPITRPLICICNDVYAPHLRSLREVAKVFRLESCPPRRLAARLRTICSLEKAAVSSQTLNRLVAATNFDVRSCLHTLQLATTAARAATETSQATFPEDYVPHVDITAVMESQIEGGLKDEGRDIMDMLQAVFWARKGSQPRRTERSLCDLDTTGIDSSKLCSALHERMLDADLRVSDPACARAAHALDTLSDADIFTGFGNGHSSRSNGQRLFVLNAYSNFVTPGVVASTHRSLHRPRIHPPRAHWEMPKLRRAKKAILDDASGLAMRISASNRGTSATGSGVDHRTLRLDVIPALTRMLRLNVRTQIPYGSMKKLEQEQLCLVANVLMDANIRITVRAASWGRLTAAGAGEKNRDGSHSRVTESKPRMLVALDPPIDDLMVGSDDKVEMHPALTSTEVLTRVRRERDAKALQDIGRNERQTLESPDLSRTPLSGRKRKASRSPVRRTPAKKILYKFQAGVTNAVRRPLRFRNLAEEWN